MSMTKRYLESLPEEEQNEILGRPDADEGEYRAAEEYAQGAYDREWAEALATETGGSELC